MQKKLHFLKPALTLALFFIFCAGCGYSTHSANLGPIHNIYIEQFKNNVDFGSATTRNLYLPLLEVKVTDAIKKRFLFDGTLKVTKKENAHIILQGGLLNYDRGALRTLENGDVQEYRITITVSLTLIDVKTGESLWSEPSFSGDATYFTSGSLAKSESAALEDALTDLGRRVIERTVQDW